MKISISQKLFLFAFIILAINGILGYSVYRSNQKVLNSEHWVNHTEQVLYQSANIRSISKEIETASRYFVITNDSAFLVPPLNNTQKTVLADIGQLRGLTQDNPAQLQRIDSLSLYMHRLISFSSKSNKSKSELGAAVNTFPWQGKGYSDHINHIINLIQLEEHTLLKQRKLITQHNEAEFNRFSMGIFILMTAFTILLIIVAGKYLYQNREKASRAAELAIANKELLFQNTEKEKRAAELDVANDELSFQSEEKGKRAAELIIANKELLFQNEEKGKRAAELTIANKELSFQNKEKELRAAELLIANRELIFQNEEKEKRAAELTIANTELLFQNEEKEKRAAELKLAEAVRITMVNELMKRNKDLEQFAYIISHNLRAPVANIIGASSALNEDGLSAGDKETLCKGINVSIIKLDEVVKDLNHILQVKGEINEVMEIVDFPGLVYDVKNSIKNLIDTYDIEIKYDFSEVDKLLTLKPYLYSIFFNLISNSVKYRRRDIRSIIKIRSHLVKNKLELIFTDNGMGIDLQKKGEQVFGLYKRFHTDIEGKGMGLFMVKTQVETLGGKISIKSEENKGTEFLIEFDI